MPWNAWGNLWSLYQYDPTVLDNLLLPDNVDRETLVENLLFETVELGLVYWDLEVVRHRIGSWSRKRLAVWNELEKTLHYDYNPIHNYDRTEDRQLLTTDDREITITSHTDDNGNSIEMKNGYNSGEQVQAGEDIITNNQDYGRQDQDDNTHQESENLYARGNIGVTSTQDLIKQQREVVQFNIYDYIIEDFKQEFCVMVY